MALGSFVQAVGEANVTYSHPTVTGENGSASVGNFKLQTQYVDTKQTIPNSVVVPLLAGGAISLTNTQKAGTLTFSAVRCKKVNAYATATAAEGVFPVDLGSADIVTLASLQVESNDSTGATIAFSLVFNGVVLNIIFEKCTVNTVTPLRLAGNDVPTYEVSFNYTNWTLS